MFSYGLLLTFTILTGKVCYIYKKFTNCNKMYESTYINSHESVNKCTKLYETVRFIKTCGTLLKKSCDQSRDQSYV